MKRNLFRMTVVLSCLCFCAALFAQEKKLEQYAGNWAFSLAEAPYDYEKGTSKMFLEEGNLKGEFKLGDVTMKVNSFTEKASGLVCTVYIDEYPIEVTLIFKDNKLTGFADDGTNSYAIVFTKIE